MVAFVENRENVNALSGTVESNAKFCDERKKRRKIREKSSNNFSNHDDLNVYSLKIE